jgi:amino acid transporter
MCFSLVSFVGSEAGAVYADEVEQPSRAIPRATLLSYAIVTTFVVLSGLALSIALGPENAVPIAQGTDVSITGGTGQPLIIEAITRIVGPSHVVLAIELISTVLLLATFAVGTSNTHMIGRYLAGLARDGALPKALGFRPNGGTPVRAALIAPFIACIFALIAVTKIPKMAPLAGAVGGLGIAFVLTMVSLSTIVWFLRSEAAESGFFGWEGQVVASAFSGVTTALIFGYGVVKLPGVVDAPGWMFPLFLFGSLVGGLVWALVLRAVRPDVLARIGRAGMVVAPGSGAAVSMSAPGSYGPRAEFSDGGGSTPLP